SAGFRARRAGWEAPYARGEGHAARPERARPRPSRLHRGRRALKLIRHAVAAIGLLAWAGVPAPAIARSSDAADYVLIVDVTASADFAFGRSGGASAALSASLDQWFETRALDGERWRVGRIGAGATLTAPLVDRAALRQAVRSACTLTGP